MELVALAPLSIAGLGIMERRFTVFSNDMIEDGGDLFEHFFGRVPDKESMQKALFKSEYSSAQNGLQCTLAVAGPRANFVITPSADVELDPSATSLFGLGFQEMKGMGPQFAVIPFTPPTIRSDFVDAAKGIVGAFPSVKRLAVGETVFWNAKSRLGAYEKLGQLLPHLHLSDDTSDLHYRINRRKSFDVGAGNYIDINRLATWNAPTLATKLSMVDSVTAVTAIAACVATDVNSNLKADLAILDPNQIMRLVDILFEISNELTEKGDLI